METISEYINYSDIEELWKGAERMEGLGESILEEGFGVKALCRPWFYQKSAACSIDSIFSTAMRIYSPMEVSVQPATK